MTVSSSQVPFKQHTANGSTATFAFPFKILDESDLALYLDDTLQTSGFSVSGVGGESFNVTFTTNPSNGVIVTGYRESSKGRTTDYQNAGDFLAATVNTDFDKAWLAIQELQRRLDLHTLTFNDTVVRTEPVNVLPEPETDELMYWSASGQLLNSGFTRNDLQTLVDSYVSGSSVTDALSVSFTPLGAGAVATTVGAFLRNVIFPQNFGAVATAGTDNYTAITNMFAYMASIGGGMCIFPPGQYDISQWVNYQVANGGNAMIMGYGAKINNTNVSAGYESDAFRIGNADLAKGEGGTNASPFEYTEHVQVQGFEFLSCRMGVWFVRCKHSGYRDLSANGNAVVGIGNDASENCYDMTGENAHMISWANKRGPDAWYIVGAFTVDGLVLKGIFSGDAEMAGPPNAKHLVIKSCTNFDVSGFILDEKNNISGGIEITELDGYGILGPGIIRNCNNGLVTFPGGGNFIHQKICKDIIIENCNIGVSCTSRQTIFDGIKTVNCTVDLAVETDADKCTFKNCEWGNDTITEGVAGRIAAMAWMNNIGGPMQNSVSVLGAYAGNRVNVVAAPPSGANFTGDGTAYTLINWTESADNYNNFDPVTGLFTSVDYGGKYEFTINVLLTNLTASGCTLLELKALYNGGSPVTIDYISNFGNTHLMRGNYKVSLNRNDTISFTVTATGGTKVVGIGAGIGRLEVVQLHN